MEHVLKSLVELVPETKSKKEAQRLKKLYTSTIVTRATAGLNSAAKVELSKLTWVTKTTPRGWTSMSSSKCSVRFGIYW